CPMDARSFRLDALGGLIAAGSALALGELAAGIAGATSMVVAVGNIVVDRTPGPAVKWAIDLLGTADKPVLLATIVTLSLAIGALLGPVAGRRPEVGAWAFAIFGVAGFAASDADPFTGTLTAALVAGVAAIGGWLVLRGLLAAAAPEEERAHVAAMPGRGIGGRRQFLALAGAATGGSALAAVSSRAFQGAAVDVEAQRRAITLPAGAAVPPVAEEDLRIEGLAPLLTPNDAFYRIDTAFVVPRVDVSSWALRVHGMVDRPL